MSIPKTGAVGEFVDYSTNTNDGNLGAEADIQPAQDGETVRATAVTDVLRRTPDNLRQRTELLRGVADDNYYLRDADRKFIWYGRAQVAWNTTTGIFTLGDDMWLVPMNTVGNSGNTPPVGSVYGSCTILRADSTPIINLASRLRSYAGGNRLHVTVKGGGALSVVMNGPYEVVCTVVNGVTTRLQFMNAFTATVPGTTITATTIAGADGDIIMTSQPRQPLVGNWDSEAHILTPANLATFFAVGGNPLTEGDSVCIRYDALIAGAGTGGRRQSIPENTNTTIPAASLFNSRVHPEWLPNAIPIAKRMDGKLFLANGVTVDANATIYPWGPPIHASTHAATGTDPIDYSSLQGLVTPGFQVFSGSATSIVLSPAGMVIDGKMRFFAGATLTTGDILAGLAANTTYYLYAYYSSGVQIEKSVTGPDTTLTLKNGDPTRTYLGAFRTTNAGGAGKIFAFTKKNRTTTYMVNDQLVGGDDTDPGFPDEKTHAGDTNLTTLTLAKIPPHVKRGRIQLDAYGGVGGNVAELREPPGAWFTYRRQIGRLTNDALLLYSGIDAFFTASQLQVKLSTAAGAFTVRVYALSYEE